MPTSTLLPLRSGEVTRDVRLDRCKEVDLRSLNHLVRDQLTPSQLATPRSKSWSLGVRLDQGEEGSCVGHGFAHELAATPAIVPNVTHEFARNDLYLDFKRNDEWEGEAYEGTSVLAGAKVCTRRGYYTGYKWALTVEDLYFGVGYVGPAVIGIDWHVGMFNPDAKGFIRPTGQIAGGHCVCITGVRIVPGPDGRPDYTKSSFIIQNSWGPSWGVDRGRAYISFIDMAMLFPGGDFCLPVGRSKGPASSSSL